MSRTKRIVIVGGGFSGASVAFHLLRPRSEQRLEIIIIEPAAELGRGVAYARSQAGYELNVLAKKMSIDQDQPSDFIEWLQAHDYSYGALDYAPRDVFGSYVEARLAEAIRMRDKNKSFAHLRAKAVDVLREDNVYLVRLDNDEWIEADTLVLCAGLGRSVVPAGLKELAGSNKRVITQPWQSDAFDDVQAKENVCVVGMGLSGVDVAERLVNKHAANVTLLSRHGLLPQAQVEAPATQVALGPNQKLFILSARTVRELLKRIKLVAQERAQAGQSWQVALDCVRENAPMLWQRLSLREKKRFLRHLRPYWETHRHRLVPRLVRFVNESVHAGVLRIAKGHVVSARAKGAQVELCYRDKDLMMSRVFDRVVICTSAVSNPELEPQSFEAKLLRHQFIQTDLYGLGIHVDNEGVAGRQIYALGARARAARWEITAVTELARRAKAMALHMLATDAGLMSGIQVGETAVDAVL